MIQFAKYYKRIGLQCLRILQKSSQNDQVAVKYPRSIPEQTEIFKALMQNLSALQTSQDARRAVAWDKVWGFEQDHFCKIIHN